MKKIKIKSRKKTKKRIDKGEKGWYIKKALEKREREEIIEN